MATGIDLYNSISFKQDSNFLPGVVNKTSINGTGIDITALGGGGQRVVAVLNVGAVTDGTHTFTLQDSPDDANWSNVVSPFIQGGFTPVTSGAGNGQNSVQKVGYLGTNRYIRVISAVTGAPVTGAAYDVQYVVGFERNLPAA